MTPGGAQRLVGIAAIFLVVGCGSPEAREAHEASPSPPDFSVAAGRAKPEGPQVTGIEFDLASLNRFANEADIWPVTVSDDGHLYTAGGDGDGWDGRRTTGMEVIRLDMPHPTDDLAQAGMELYRKPNVLPKGIVSVGGVLYLLEQERGNGFGRARIGRSTDHGRTWEYDGNGVTTWEIDNNAFASGHFINFGPDYSDARDRYVYVLGLERLDGRNEGLLDRVVLARVPRDDVQRVESWEYFNGSADAPSWSARFADRTAVFRRDKGIHWGATINYNPVLERYLLSFFVDDAGDLEVFEGPEPWGPWHSIHAGRLADAEEKYSLFFVSAPGWLSRDGKEWWFVTSGRNEWDSFNVMRAELTTGD